MALRVELRLLLAGEIVDDSDATIITEVDRAEPALTRRRLSPLELRTQPGTAGDPVRALQALPGVARPPSGLSGRAPGPETGRRQREGWKGERRARRRQKGGKAGIVKGQQHPPPTRGLR